MRVTVLHGLVLGLLISACGNAAGRDGTPLSRATGAGDVVVQVMVAGGFVPPEVAVAAVPTVTVLGDGTVITTAPVALIYPGPAITPLQSVRVPSGTVDELVARAAELGLLGGPLDFGQPPVADAPDTIVTITAAGRQHRHVANALGMEDRPGAGIGEQAAANRRALRAFVDATSALPPGASVWKPQAVAVYSLGDYVPEPNLTQPGREWPLPGAPATCTLVEGADVDVLLEALGRANARTPWLVDGRATSLAFRPVVPGQPGCPAG
jgi:hypothetical protein